MIVDHYLEPAETSENVYKYLLFYRYTTNNYPVNQSTR